MIGKIPPKGVSISDFICTFAMSFGDFAILLFAALSLVKIRDDKALNIFLLLRNLQKHQLVVLRKLGSYGIIQMFEWQL